MFRFSAGFLLLASAAVAQQAPYSWRGVDGSGVFPARDLVTEFYDLAADMKTEGEKAKPLTLPAKPGERKNIVWRTLLPHWGQNAPVVVKDRVFVMCEEGWKDDAPVLLCLSAVDGKILWKQPVDHLDAWPEEKAKPGRELRAKNHAYWRAYMQAWNRTFWDEAKNGFARHLAADGEKLLAAAKSEGFDLSRSVSRETGDDGREYLGQRRGVSGGWRSRYYWTSGTPQMLATYKECNKNRYHWYTGWTSEGPYFGMVMGSVVSDGQRVYAITGLDAAACFDLDGRRLWVTDMNGPHVTGYPASAPGIISNHMASPVLADGMLVYYHRDGVMMYGLEAATGKIAWKTPAPEKSGEYRDRSYLNGRNPRGYAGHMGPGGTPVVMRLGGATVAVSGHGMVVRVSDGKYLGQVCIPAKALGAVDKPEGDEPANEATGGDYYGASYGSWVAQGDVLYCAPGAGLFAVQLGLKGDALSQQVLWRFDGKVESRVNMVCYGGRLYASVSQDKRRGIAALDSRTGKPLAWGPTAGGHDTSLGFAAGVAVWPAGYIGDKTENKSNPAATPGHGMSSYVVVSLPDLKPLGKGYLCPEAPAGEVRDRHIARMGTGRVVWGNAGITCWGNRVFVRNNDYIWCIGDPAKPYLAPEEAMEKR